MSINPQPQSPISNPNLLTSEAQGSVSAPNNLTSQPQGQIGIPNTLTPIVNPLADWDNLPLSHTRIGYEQLLVNADTENELKALEPNTYERTTENAGVISLVWQLSALTTIDYVGIAAHTLAGTTLDVRYSTVVGGPYTTIETISPTDNSAIMILLDTPTDVVEIAISGNTTQDIEIGVVQAGVALQMYQPLYGGHSPIDLSPQTDYQSNNSDTGQFLGRTIIRKGLESGYSYRHLDPDWYRQRFLPFVEHARSLPFFIKWRPDLFDASAFGYTTSDITPVNMGGGHSLMSVNFNVRAHADV